MDGQVIERFKPVFEGYLNTLCRCMTDPDLISRKVSEKLIPYQ